MSKEFRLSAFAVEGGYRLENQTVENCRIMGIQYRNFDFIDCRFHKVIFENAFEGETGQYVNIQGCEFTDCEFRNQYRGIGVRLNLHCNVFTDCRVINTVYHGYMEPSEIRSNRFINCHFRSIEIQGNVSLSGLEMTGGSIRYIDYIGSSITQSTFSGITMEDILVKAALTDNRMENVVFRDVTIRGSGDDRNELENCTNRYTFIKERT